MAIDVVIPALGRPELTMQAVQSVLGQTCQNFEIYLIEDGKQALQPLFDQLDPRLHYHSLPANRGPAFARNYGASLGHSEFIAFLDSDDRWQPQKLQKQFDFFQDHPGIQWLHTNEIWFRNGQEVKQHKKHGKQGGFLIERLLERCLVSPSAVIFRRGFWQEHGGFLPWFRVAEDYELWLRLNFRFELGYLEEALTIKQAGDWSQLSQTPEIDRQRVLALHRFYRLYHDHPAFAQIREKWQNEILKKIKILQKGAEKYGHRQKLLTYQNWERLFSTFRT